MHKTFLFCCHVSAKSGSRRAQYIIADLNPKYCKKVKICVYFRITAYEGKHRQSDADLSANTRPDLGTLPLTEIPSWPISNTQVLSFGVCLSTWLNRKFYIFNF